MVRFDGVFHSEVTFVPFVINKYFVTRSSEIILNILFIKFLINSFTHICDYFYVVSFISICIVCTNKYLDNSNLICYYMYFFHRKAQGANKNIVSQEY
jgi:hypothetical protein